MLLDTNNLDPILSELNHFEVEELVLRYCFSDDSVTELINRYHLNCAPHKLLKAFPLVLTDLQCPYCQQKMVCKILSKASRQKLNEPFCPHCNHSQSRHCTCFHCKKQEFFQQNALSEKDIISQVLITLDVNYPLQSIADLSLKDALYLKTLIRSSITISREGHVGPIAPVPPLAPHDSGIVLNHLIDRGLITVSPSTETSAFTVVNNEVQDMDFMRAKWKVHLENFEVTLLQLNNSWPAKWHHEVKAVWLEIAMLECAEFLEYLANERQFDLEITDELKNNFLTLLRHYSVTQCFSMMRDAAREVSDHVVKETLSRSEAGNHILQFCFQAMKNPCAFKEDSRPYTIPQSQLSYVFHYEFVKIEEAGFTAIPHDIN